MALFTVWRSFDPAWGASDFELMQVRAIATAWMEPPYRWQRSFGFNKLGVNYGCCVYEGPSAGDLTWQQRMCWVPVDEVREVVEVSGASRGPGPDERPSGCSLYLVERSFGNGSSPQILEEANNSTELAVGRVTWMRSFWDPGRESSKCLFAADSEQSLKRVLDVAGASIQRLEQVETNHPSRWAATYDRMGLPRHWETDQEDGGAN